MSIYVKKSSTVTNTILDYDQLMKVRELTETVDGMITFPHIGMRLVFGVWPFSGLTEDSISGGCIQNIDLSTFHFVTDKPLWAICQARYKQGLPKCCNNSLTTTTLTLFGDTIVRGAYIHWCVLGPYSE